MPCEHYQEALIESAATGAEPQGELRAHLAACPACRAAFVEEQSLFSSIDAGLHVTANAEVPASFLPRVRARLDETSVPQSQWVPAWAAAAASIAVVAGLLVFHGGGRGPGRQETESGHEARNVLPSETVAGPRENWAGARAQPLAVKRSKPTTVKPALAVKEPVVLVPAGQEEAINHLLDGVRRGEIKGEVLVADGRDREPQVLRIIPLEVVPVDIKPLENTALAPR